MLVAVQLLFGGTMATGTIEFVAPVKGLRFEMFEVSNQHQAIEKIVLTAQDEQVNVVFHLNNIFDSEEAEGIATDILPSIINGLAFYTNRPIGEPRFTGGKLPKDASGSSYTVITTLTALWATAGLTDLRLADEERKELATFLEQHYTSNYLYSAYRFAIIQSDPIARYMFLYNILLQLKKDDQKQVDDFIRLERPGVPQSLSGDPTLKAKGVWETSYTLLRNEIAHRRQGTTPQETRREIHDNVAAFQELVKTAISQVVS